MNLGQTIKINAKKLLSTKYSKAIGYICIVAIVFAVLHLLDVFAFRILDIKLIRVSGSIFKYGMESIDIVFAFCITLASVIIKLVLAIPLIFGIVNWFVYITSPDTNSAAGLFAAYESKLFWRSIGLTINLFFKWLISFIVLPGIPLALTGFTYYIAKSSGKMSSITQVQRGSLFLLPAISLIITCVALFIWLIFIQRYSLAPMLISEKYRYSVHSAVKTSVKYMRGHKKNMLFFKLSFAVWLLPLLLVVSVAVYMAIMHSGYAKTNPYDMIALIVAGLTFVLLMPYYGLSSVMYARYCYEYGERAKAGQLSEPSAHESQVHFTAHAEQIDSTTVDAAITNRQIAEQNCSEQGTVFLEDTPQRADAATEQEIIPAENLIENIAEQNTASTDTDGEGKTQ